jgi:hypothetical protein
MAKTVAFANYVCGGRSNWVGSKIFRNILPVLQCIVGAQRQVSSGDKLEGKCGSASNVAKMKILKGS